jgi:hypothetical protein
MICTMMHIMLVLKPYAERKPGIKKKWEKTPTPKSTRFANFVGATVHHDVSFLIEGGHARRWICS